MTTRLDCDELLLAARLNAKNRGGLSRLLGRRVTGWYLHVGGIDDSYTVVVLDSGEVFAWLRRYDGLGNMREDWTPCVP